MNFCEQTTFAERHFADTPQQYDSYFDPGTLQHGDKVLVDGYRLVGPAPEYPDLFWSDSIIRILP